MFSYPARFDLSTPPMTVSFKLAQPLASLIFGGLLETLFCRHGGAAGFLLKSPRSLPLLARWVPYLSLPVTRVLLAVSYLFNYYFLRTTTAMAKKKITGAELAARAKANGYQRGAH
jgi:hypothetical protein